MTKVKKNTKKEILDITAELILTKGYNSFSYKDISDQVGIKKASIHHHFPVKKDLGLAYIKHYYHALVKWSEGINNKSNGRKLEALYMMYRYISNNCAHICPAGMLSAEYPTLPVEIQEEVKNIFSYLEKWLTEILEDGILKREFKNSINPEIMSKIIINAFTGTLKTARIFNDLDQLDYVYEEFKQVLINR